MTDERKQAERRVGWARLWAGVSVQYDHLRDDPSFFSGYGTLGAERGEATAQRVIAQFLRARLGG